MKNKHEFIHILMDKARDTKYFESTSRMSAKEAFLQTEKELSRLNSIVNNKKISDVTIGNSIFRKLRGEISDAEIEIFAKNHFAAAFYSFLDIKQRMIKDGSFSYGGIKKYGYLINEILFDILIFANHIGQEVDPEYVFFIGGKRNIEDSRWHYLGTLQLLYNSTHSNNMLDDKFAFIVAPVALRQTIELKMNRIIGLGDMFDKKGKKIFTKHNFIFNFIKKNKALFEFNIELKIIQKIFEFCNESVHKGIMPYYWQMFYAIKFCDSLFFDPNYKGSSFFHIHSAIKIKNYAQLKANLENELIKQFPSPEYDLDLHWVQPEAQLL